MKVVFLFNSKDASSPSLPTILGKVPCRITQLIVRGLAGAEPVIQDWAARHSVPLTQVFNHKLKEILDLHKDARVVCFAPGTPKVSELKQHARQLGFTILIG